MINPALVGTWTTGSDPDTCYAEFLTRGEFRIQHCRSCRQHQFYPRLVCMHCGSVDLAWQALPTARAYFIAGMGGGAGAGGNTMDMVIWTSSELPDTGFGLTDYQTNAAVDKWLGEKVLLNPGTTRCTLPAGVFPNGQGGMLRAIAYGSELNLAHPPRPKDPKAVWEPEWAAKIRVKSMTTVMLGMPSMERPPARKSGEEPSPKPEEKKEDKVPKPLDLLKGILGR